MSADEALQKIEKFKNSFKKNLEKNLSEFKKNITDIVRNAILKYNAMLVKNMAM